MKQRNNKVIPFLDLQAQYQNIKPEIDRAIFEVLNQSSYIRGPAVEQFETDFAAYCETQYAVGCNSGTSALHLALRSFDIGPGDEVITVSHTFIATVWAILYCGAVPIFVDVDPVTRTIDTAKIEYKVTERTKAIIPVHLYGHPADMDSVIITANKYNLKVIEDAAQAHGARYKGRRVGSIGHIGCFSFYPGKNLGAYGEGGAVVTNDSHLADKVKMICDHGQKKRYHHNLIGYNYRMDGIQGAVLGVKLKYLDQWNSDRRAIAAKYDQLLSDATDLVRPVSAGYAYHVYHHYVVEVKKRKTIKKFLEDSGISCGLHYPIPVHRQKIYSDLKLVQPHLPNSNKIASRCLSLPIYPEMSAADLEIVCNTLKMALDL